ncbi:MAG TPA: hypothetical protein DD491_05875 [Halieaceae bacterium]|nr:hypothetical protein [Halieaceae bacterium]
MESIVNQVTGNAPGFIGLIVWCAIAIVVGAAGGALGGILVAGKDLDRDLAAWMGGFYGVTAALPGIGLAYVVLMFL